MKPTILIVEADDAVRHSLCMVLEVYGFPVEGYADVDGLFARGALDNSCIVLDMDLPEAAGFEVLARLQAGGYRVPVVLVTGRVSTPRKRAESHLNVLSLLEKPIDIDLLLEAIQSLER